MKLAQRTRRWLLPSGFFAAMLILTGVALADGNPSAAKSRVMGAKSLMESHRYDEVEDKLKEAEKFLQGATDAEKAPIVADIKAIRAELVPHMKAANDKVIRAAKEAFDQAKKFQADGMDTRVADKLQEAENLLKDLPDADKAPLLAEIKAFRTARPAPKSEEARAIEDRILRDLRQAERDIDPSPRNAADELKAATRNLNSDEAKKALDAATIQTLQARIAEVRAKLGGGNKNAALARAAAPLAELEERMAKDPYQGLDQTHAHRVDVDIKTLATRVHAAIDDLPKDDADVKAVSAKLAALEAKAAAGSALWTRTQDIARLTGSWKFDQQGFAGWEAETPGQPSGGWQPWLMSKTGLAIKHTNYWLAEKQTKALVNQYPDDPTVQATLAEAEKTREAAAAKLHDAFNKTLDEAEKMPLPMRSYDQGRPAIMALEAGDWFANTKYKDANVARANKLDAKWKAEMAAIEKEAAEALRTMTAQANADWPRIVASIKFEEGFNPGEAAKWKGRIIRLKGVRNRSGWDFDGHYDFAMWLDGAVLAGDYDPRVGEAVNEACRRIRRSVDDHTDWEVIAVVQGSGKINQRVTTELIDERTRDRIAKIESHRPIDCTLIKVIALHAGPVAVGPK